MTTVRGAAMWLCLITPILFFAGCAADWDLTTRPGHQLTEPMFVGSWILDEDQTNRANGAPEGAEVSDEILKGVFGKSWKFKPNGVLKTELPAGWKNGSWRIVDPDNLVVNEGNGEQQYAARFHDGDLCLKKADGKTLVLERD